MIPKIIHYCWFGKGLMPKSQKDCIKSWKKILPDYEFKCWDEGNFDINTCEYSSEAYKAKKYAYVSDVARCYALFKFGGIYLDTDVELFENFDQYLPYNFFSALEIYKEFSEQGLPYLNNSFLPNDAQSIVVPFFGILCSVIGAAPGNELVKDCINYYTGYKVDKENFKGFSIDDLIGNRAIRYGFVYQDKKQILDNNMLVLHTGIFGYADSINNEYSVLYHHNAGSWYPKSDYQKLLIKFDKLHLLSIYTKYKSFKKRVKRLLYNK